MYLVPIAWMYVVLMMAVAEAMSPQGTLLGAGVTFVLYGLMPLAIVMYIMGTPARRRARLQAEAKAEADASSEAPPSPTASAAAPDGRRQPAGPSVAPEREEA